MTKALTDIQLQTLIEAVQHNCDLADAHYAGDDTLCIYLLKMRDYFRWASNSPVDQPVNREILGDWITEKESRWDDIEEADYVSVPLGDESFDRFDNESINRILNPLGLIYSGGLGRRSRPDFFLGKLIGTEQTESFKVLICGNELARSLTAPPAMSHPGNIYIRRDALRRYLAGKIEEWSWKKQDNAMGKVIAQYDFDSDPGALDRLVDNELENLILHEIGERVAGEMIGQGWQAMVGQIENPILELKARAVRDNLADCVCSLPAFLTLDDKNSLDFYYANMTALRKELFPSFCDAYQRAKEQGDYKAISKVVSQGREHWLRISRQLVGNIDSMHPFSKGDMENIEKCLDSCAF